MGTKEWLLNRTNLFTLSVISAIRGTRDNLRGVVWQPFALSLGLEMREIGSLESVIDGVKLVLEPIMGVISDSIGRKKLMIARELLILAAGIALILAQSWHLLFIASALVGASMALISVWSSLVAESAEPGRLAFIYSVTGACFLGAGLIGTLGAGYLADALGFNWVYIVSTAFGTLSLLLVASRLPETMTKKTSRVEWRRAIASPFHALKPPKHLRGFYIAMAFDLLAFGMGFRLLNGMLTRSYGYTPTMIGIYMTAMTAVQAVAQIPLGRLADRLGYSKFMAASQFTATIMLGMLLYSKSFEWVFVAHMILGLANAFWMPAEQAWIATNVDPNERAQALGSFSTFRGLAALPAPIIGGILFDAFGFDFPITANLVLAFIDGVLIMLWVRDKPRK